ncbi:trypsin-like peptidase domain-containing protein, partial [Bacteroidota bacterium]
DPIKPQYTALPDKYNTEMDFSYAAEKTVDAVVHVTTIVGGEVKLYYDPFRRREFQQKEPDKIGYGSGVIITSDGHIVTNNHVIESSKKIKVKLNDGREYDAEVIGTDPDTDLAVIKIDEEDLQFIVYGDSEELKIGAWVLAVGNPFNLYSTVTTGIVSAKARGLHLIGRDNNNLTGIESYIQTDAAVNMGNSGGALVNLRGELVGINSAIMSQTGMYSGYSFAIPVSIAQKVVEDIIKFGDVHRAVMGVIVEEINSSTAEIYGLEKIEGVRVSAISEDGPAHKAGIELGDVILSANNDKINSNPELLEKMSAYSPGDEIDLLIRRNNVEKNLHIKLQKSDPDAKMIYDSYTYAGAELKKLSESELYKLDLENGVLVNKINKGKFKAAGIEEGFIITKINYKRIIELDDIRKTCENAENLILIEGYYKSGRRLVGKYYYYEK